MSAKLTEPMNQLSMAEDRSSVACLAQQISELFKRAAPNMTYQEKTTLNNVLHSISRSVLFETEKTSQDTASKVKEAKNADDQVFEEMWKKAAGILKGVKKESNVKDCFNIHLATVETKFDVLKLHHEKIKLESEVAKLNGGIEQMELNNEDVLFNEEMKYVIKMERLESNKKLNLFYVNIRP